MSEIHLGAAIIFGLLAANAANTKNYPKLAIACTGILYSAIMYVATAP